MEIHEEVEIDKVLTNEHKWLKYNPEFLWENKDD